jgi:adenosylhomocysteine nucleosidase
VLAGSGIGLHRARAAARNLVAHGVRALLSWGTAGALDPELAPGTLVLPSAVIGSGGERFGVDPGWHGRVSRCLADGLRFSSEPLLTVSEACASVGAKRALFECYRAAGVDMESAGIAEVARDSGVPFLTLRAIVDPAEEPLPQAVVQALAESGGPLPRLRLILELASKPADWAGFLRLAAHSRRAQHSLARAARTAAGPLLSLPGAQAEGRTTASSDAVA